MNVKTETALVTVRMPNDLLAEIDRLVRAQDAQGTRSELTVMFGKPNRSQTLRQLLTAGLGALEKTVAESPELRKPRRQPKAKR